MQSKIVKLACAGVCALCVSCAPFGDTSSLERRVDEQDIQLRQMQPQQADTWNEVQAMRQEIAQLKGQLAELNRAGGAVAERGRQPDESPGQAGGNMGLNPPPGSPIVVSSGAPYGGQTFEPVTGITLSPANAPESSAYRNVGSATAPAPQPQRAGTYGLPPEPAPVAPTEETWGKADPQPASEPPAPKKDLATALFDAGVNAFNGRQYQEAERSFKDFLKNYPKNAQAGQAQFYLAECLFQRNRFPEAALEYNTVLTKYSKSPSAPEAMLKQGIAFSKMGQPEAAKKRMQEIISKYPSSAQATRAKNFLKTNK